MTQILIAGYNRGAVATLSGGSWNASYPLSNVKTRFKAQKARSSDALAASTKFDIDLASTGYDPTIVALIGTNLTSSATVTISGDDNASFTSPLTTVISGTGNTPDAFIPLSNAGVNYWADCRYLRVEISDTSNPDGYISIGCLYVGANGWGLFSSYASFGYEFGYQTDTSIRQSLSNIDFFSLKPIRRVLTVSFEAMDATERRHLLNVLARDINDNWLVMLDRDESNASLRQKHSFLCRGQQWPMIKTLNAVASGANLELIEVI